MYINSQNIDSPNISIQKLLVKILKFKMGINCANIDMQNINESGCRESKSITELRQNTNDLLLSCLNINIQNVSIQNIVSQNIKINVGINCGDIDSQNINDQDVDNQSMYLNFVQIQIVQVSIIKILLV